MVGIAGYKFRGAGGGSGGRARSWRGSSGHGGGGGEKERGGGGREGGGGGGEVVGVGEEYLLSFSFTTKKYCARRCVRWIGCFRNQKYVQPTWSAVDQKPETS